MAGKKRSKKIGNDIYGVKNDLQWKERAGETGKTEFRHSSYYHKYFHGYTEVRREKPNGKYSFERFYTMNWFVQDITNKKWWMIRIAYSVLTLMTCILYLTLMSLPGFAGNVSHYVAIPGFLSVFCLLLLFVSMIAYLTTKRKMTWWEQHSSTTRIKRYSLASSIALGITGIVILANIFMGVESIKKEILLALGVILCAVGTACIYLIEDKVQYREEKNDIVLPEGEAHQIL